VFLAQAREATLSLSPLEQNVVLTTVGAQLYQEMLARFRATAKDVYAKKKPRRNNKPLKCWFDLHADDPYPTREIKAELARASGLTFTQVCTWFINERQRRFSRGTLGTRLEGTSDPFISVFSNVKDVIGNSEGEVQSEVRLITPNPEILPRTEGSRDELPPHIGLISEVPLPYSKLEFPSTPNEMHFLPSDAMSPLPTIESPTKELTFDSLSPLQRGREQKSSTQFLSLPTPIWSVSPTTEITWAHKSSPSGFFSPVATCQSPFRSPIPKTSISPLRPLPLDRKAH